MNNERYVIAETKQRTMCQNCFEIPLRCENPKCHARLYMTTNTTIICADNGKHYCNKKCYEEA